MVESVTQIRYKTKQGNIFDTLHDAERHEAHYELSEAFGPLPNGMTGMGVASRAMDNLIRNRSAIFEALKRYIEVNGPSDEE